MEEAVDAEEAAGGEPLDAAEAAVEEEVEAAEEDGEEAVEDAMEKCVEAALSEWALLLAGCRLWRHYFPLSTRSSLSDALKGLVISSPSSESSSTSGLQAIYN